MTERKESDYDRTKNASDKARAWADGSDHAEGFYNWVLRIKQKQLGDTVITEDELEAADSGSMEAQMSIVNKLAALDDFEPAKEDILSTRTGMDRFGRPQMEMKSAKDRQRVSQDNKNTEEETPQSVGDKVEKGLRHVLSAPMKNSLGRWTEGGIAMGLIHETGIVNDILLTYAAYVLEVADPQAWLTETEQNLASQFGNPVVDGGTGWAVQMAIDMEKEVYLFNESTEQILWWAGDTFVPVTIDQIKVSKEFAGIGTRSITQKGKEFVAALLEKMPEGATIHSGGADGADTAFETVGEEKKAKVIAHSFKDHGGAKNKKTRHEHSKAQLKKANKQLIQALSLIHI